jgi:hypothetical protein
MFHQQDQETGALKALRPIGAAEFILAPRQLPPIKDIEVRLDSSLWALNVEVSPKPNILVDGLPLL